MNKQLSNKEYLHLEKRLKKCEGALFSTQQKLALAIVASYTPYFCFQTQGPENGQAADNDSDWLIAKATTAMKQIATSKILLLAPVILLVKVLKR